MNKNIRTAVDECQTLTMKVNVGERHRISRDDIKSGSLWITPQRSNFKVLLTGEVDLILSGYFRQNFGDEAGTDQNHRYWKVQDIHEVIQLIHQFNNR